MNYKRLMWFIDDNIVGNPRFAKELFRALIPFKLKWAGQASVTIAKDDELLKLASESGCMILLIGFETLSPDNLVAMGKRVNVVDKYEMVIRKIHSYGIAIHGFFILGLDDDDEDVFERTVRFAQSMQLESAQFAWPTPYPGTALYESLDKAGRLITKSWSQYESNVVFEPKLMSRDILKRGRDWVWKEFYSLPSIWRRLGITHRYLVPLWTLNLYYRSFWRRKSKVIKDSHKVKSQLVSG